MAASLPPQDTSEQAKSLGSHHSGGWPKSSSVSGAIIRAILCETHKRQTRKVEKNKFQAVIPAFKEPYVFCYKYRYLIVVKTFYDHYVALPLWSFSRQGLKGKPASLRAECIAVQALSSSHPIGPSDEITIIATPFDNDRIKYRHRHRYRTGGGRRPGRGSRGVSNVVNIAICHRASALLLACAPS
jgi:hypothetical protein